MDFTNWAKEREKLRQDIFKDIAQQQDRKGVVTLSGSYTANPQHFVAGNFYQFGPFLFDTGFSGQPRISWGQVAQQDADYVIHPYVKKWHHGEGRVDGFYLGLYAMIQAPIGLEKHIVSWLVHGKASRYIGEYVTDAWTQPYNENRADHLHWTDDIVPEE